MREFPEACGAAMRELTVRIDDGIDALPNTLPVLASAVLNAHRAFLIGFWFGRTALPTEHDAEQVGKNNSVLLDEVTKEVGARLALTVEQMNVVTAFLSPLLAEVGDILDAAIGPPSNDRGLIIASKVVQ